MAAELQKVKDDAKILAHDHGWSQLGTVCAIGGSSTIKAAHTSEESLEFYLGPDTRLSL